MNFWSSLIYFVELTRLFSPLCWWCAAFLDLVFGYHAFRSIKLSGVIRLVLKLITSAAWVIVLTICYVRTWDNPQGLIGDIQKWLGKSWESSYLFVAAVVVYLIPNFIGAFFFLFPMIRRWIENSNNIVVRVLIWWSQVCSPTLQKYPLMFVFITLFF
jgi:callose synthase